MIKREAYLAKIRPFMNKPIIKVLTGIRRCGKSVMLELISHELRESGVSEEDILFINFESGRVEEFKTLKGLYSEVEKRVGLSGRRVYLFLDEIQELEGWETAVNSCLIDFDVDIYITGSNAKLLSGELATYLAGRYVEFQIYPFSYQEVLQLKKKWNPAVQDVDVFMEYLKLGGMPFIYQMRFDETASKQYLNDIYDSIVLKDIIGRNKVRDIALLKRILLFLIANIGNTFSASAITKFLKNERRTASPETLYNYIDHCKTACFIHLLSREDLIGKQILSFQEKIYMTDHGIREAIYGGNERDINQVLENIVFMELLRRGYEIHVGKNQAKEVDFSASRGNEKIYVQVTYLLASVDTIEREFSALETIPDNYPKYVVSMDEINRSRNGIKHVNIRQFLLQEKYDL